MKPGRELDALVAEKVMGWIYDELLAWESADGIYTGQPRPRPYSTDIAAAWEVIEHLKRLGLVINIHNCDAPDKWFAVILEPLNEWASHADTAPHAICLAALKAVGVKYEAD